MANKILTPEDWLRIKTEYQFGEKSIRQIAGENGISDGTIRAKIKAEGWTQVLREQVIDLKKNINDITQMIIPEQRHIVAEKIKTLFDTQLEAFGLVKDTALLALKIHKNITIKTHNKLATGQYTEPQAAQILKMQGLDVTGSMRAIGIQEDKPQDKAKAVDSDLTPAEIYQRLIKGE